MNSPLLARFDGKPFLVSPDMQGVFESCLHQAEGHLGRIEASTEKPKMLGSDDFWFDDQDWRAAYRPYNVKNGILQIPVKGVLLHDFPYQLGSWATGYDYIWRAFQRGMGDSSVKGIALVCDTPGGEVAGNFDLVDKMFAMKGGKEIRGYAMESAYSAGYSIISVSNSITVSRTGGVGSIGVITAHVDMSAAMERNGYKITFIHFGKHKKDGNRFEALSPEVKERIQTRIDELGEIFVATVARNRGMDVQAIRDTEALTFTASQAVSNGLADNIGSLDDAIAAFAADLSQREKDETMTEKENAAITQAAVDTVRAESKAEGLKEGIAQGMEAARARISAIVGSDEGKKRPTTAMKMALNGKFASVDAEGIVEMLADLPEEKAAVADPKAPKGKEGAAADFTNAMNSAEHPNAGVVTEMTAEQESAERRRRAAASVGRLKVVDQK